jgi:hypothetical protein
MRQGYFIGGLGALAAIVGIVIGLEVQVATARTAPIPTPIDRSLKGDRLPLIPSPRGATTPVPKLLDGCESSFSSIRRSPMNAVAGRCVA